MRFSCRCCCCCCFAVAVAVVAVAVAAIAVAVVVAATAAVASVVFPKVVITGSSEAIHFYHSNARALLLLLRPRN